MIALPDCNQFFVFCFFLQYLRLLLYYTSQIGFGRYKVETLMIYCCVSSGSILHHNLGEGSLASSSFVRIHCCGEINQHLLISRTCNETHNVMNVNLEVGFLVWLGVYSWPIIKFILHKTSFTSVK